MLNLQITELPDPYGDCNASDGYVQSKCLTACVEDYVVKNCSCKDTYMSSEDVVISYHIISEIYSASITKRSRTIGALQKSAKC